MIKIKKLLSSFKYAFSGIKSALKTEQNLRVHCLAMLLVIVLGVVLRLTIWEWVACVGCFVMVIGTEMMNTAIEKTVDLACQERNETAKLAKDIAAGAVLIFAIGAVIIGLLIFVPKVVLLCQSWS